jgi:hypothetical protein
VLEHLLEARRLGPDIESAVACKLREAIFVVREHQRKREREGCPIGRIEPDEPAPDEASIALRFEKKRAREHEPAEHEEEIDCRPRAKERNTQRRPEGAGMAQEHRQGRDPAQPVELRQSLRAVPRPHEAHRSGSAIACQELVDDRQASWHCRHLVDAARQGIGIICRCARELGKVHVRTGEGAGRASLVRVDLQERMAFYAIRPGPLVSDAAQSDRSNGTRTASRSG